MNEQSAEVTEQKTETVIDPPKAIAATQPTPVVRQSIELQDGIVVPKTIDEAYRYSAAVHKSGLAPKHFDSPEKVMVAMQTAQELGLQPLTALKSMYVVNGTVSLFGDLPLALVRKSGLLDWIEEKQYDQSGNEISSQNNNMNAECSVAVCRIKRRGEPEASREFSWSEAVKAGISGSNTYSKYRRRMLQMRARSWALKDTFSDVLLGVSIDEYDNVPIEKDVTEIPENKYAPKKSSLNELLNKEKTAGVDLAKPGYDKTVEVHISSPEAEAGL